MPDAPRRVKFANVSPPARRAPSWMPQQARGGKRESPSLTPPPSPSMKPPRLPAEFVDAIRQELGEMPYQERRSLRPSEHAANAGAVRAPTIPPTPEASAEAEPSPSTSEPVHAVDPELTAAFEEAVELLVAERQRVFEQTASQLAELAAVIARRVISREISLHPELVYDLVREGLEALGKHDRVLVRLGSSFETQRAALEQRLADRGSHAEVRVEPGLPDHACLVETELGQVDESVESRLGTLLHALRPDAQGAE